VWHVALDGHAMQDALGTVCVTDDSVLGAAVVPDEKVAFLPAVPPRELRT
jgi:hypothetical protein